MSSAPDLAALWRGRLDRIVPTAFLVALAFVQRPGWTSADTKLDLYTNPGGFLGRALSLWDPLAAGGQLQNQAYGYLFPLGPFFWLGHILGLPAWVVQRLWWALILVLAYHGVRLVLERLGIGTNWSRVIAAFSYALAPRMLIGLGAISSEIWPMAVAPWILLPLVSFAPGLERSAALRSGTAILLLGAVNAVASLAVLVLPLWWILTRQGRPRRALLGWWSASVVIATAWWIGPLLLLGRFSPPFLDWIEESRVTTSAASVTESLRGTTQWLAAISGGKSAIWPAGWAVLSSRNVVLFGLVIVLAGLIGLALARRPWSVFARGGLLIGLVLVTMGHLGGVAGPWAGAEADLLDGVLAPFRNTHKFEVVVRLPIAIGIAHALPLTVRGLQRIRAPWPQLGAALVVLALIGQTAAPAFIGVLQRGPFLGVSRAWADAAQWLAEHPDGGRTLLLPGGNAPARFWGEPRDEPMQTVATEPWIVRDGVPLGGAGATRLLDEVEARVSQGRGGLELLTLLDNLAVTKVVLVGDHQRPNSRFTPPVVVRAALVDSGARSVASFGQLVGGTTDVQWASDWGLDRPMRELEVFDVRTTRSISPTQTTASAAATTLGGGPEGIAALPRQIAVLEADSASLAAVGPGGSAATDTLQRRLASFATATDVYGPLLAAEEPYPGHRSNHDYWPGGLSEDDSDLARWQAVRFDEGRIRASASSSLAEPALGQGRDLASDAWRAFDGSGDTAWRSAGYAAPGQWVQLDWAEPIDLPAALTVTLDTVEGADVAALSIVTDQGTVRTPVTSSALAGDGVDRRKYPVSVAVPAGASRSLRLVVEAVHDRRAVVTVTDIGAGVLPRVQPWVRLASTADGPDMVAIRANTDDRPGCYPMSSGVLACSPDRRRVGEEAATMRRIFTVAEPRAYTMKGTAVASGEGADALLRRLDGVRATGSSRWMPEPGVSPELAVDGDPRTYWASSPGDTTPTLTVTWPGSRRVAGLVLSTDPDVAGRRPTAVEVTIAGRTVPREVGGDGRVDLPDVSAKRVKIVITATTTQRALTATGARTMPVVVGDVALLGEPWAGAVAADAPVSVPCGFGPVVQINGRSYGTTVSGTRAQVLARTPVTLQVCGKADLGTGAQRLQTLSSGEFAVRDLLLDARAALPGSAPPAGGGPVSVRSWGDTSRTVELPAAEATSTLLVVRENANPGWRATAGSTELRSVTVDGWAQGWVVPAGVMGTVELRFGPQAAFVASLVAGAVLALLLLVLSVRARPVPGTVPDEVDPGIVGDVGAGVLVVAIAGFLGAAAVGLALGLKWVARPRLLLVAAGTASLAWLGWAVFAPWPAALATNRDAVSGALALFLLALATTWGRARRRSRAESAGRRAALGPALDRGLEEVPARGGDEARRDEGDHHGDPEARPEQLEPEHVPYAEHDR